MDRHVTTQRYPVSVEGACCLMPPQVRRVGAYAKLLANYAADDAIIAAGEAAELLFVRGMAFCATSDSDGYITDAQVVRYVGAGMKDAPKRAEKLAEVGLWERVSGGYQVRSWTSIHPTTEEKGRKLKADRDRKRGFQTELAKDSGRIPRGIRTEGSAESLSLIHNSAETETEQLLAPGKPARKPDLIFEAVAEVCGVTVADLTKSARGELNAACKQLRDVEATPNQIKVRAVRYRREYPGASLTPSALAKHWAAFGGNSARPVERPAQGW